MYLRLVLALLLAAPLGAQTINVDVDAAANRGRIDPNIYGLNHATQAQLADLNVPLNRAGGNAATRYNWQQNCSNRAFDWFFESLEDGPATPGEEVDTFIAATKAANAQPMITMPILGWVSKLGPNRERLASFSIAKYGAQQRNDWEWFPDAGNGVRPDGTLITNNDPADANMEVDTTFMTPWMQHLVATWGSASSGGVRWYILDNEYSIWQSTHRDVKREGATMDEVLERMIAYGGMIKSVDPNARVVGPEEWGWTGFFLSGYDQQWAAANNNWSQTPDKLAHHGWEYTPFLLARLRDHHRANNRRLLDAFTLHYYPQGGEYSNDTSASMQQRRNRSTRALWDPNYTDESWISDKVRLIPRMLSWVDTHYPGTPIGLTEYSWGGDAHINGATTQADILGIFGREGLDLANRWVTPATGSPAYNAIRMYRNYDGAKSTFGDVSVRATVPNPDTVSAFAALRSSDRALTIVLINKVTTESSISLNLANFFATGAAQRWQLTASNAIARMTDVTVGASTALTLPAQSITLLVIPGGDIDVTPPALEVGAVTYDAASARWTFTGTAGDASRLRSVTYRVAGPGGASGNVTGTTSWSLGPMILNGTFLHVIFTATDNAGNVTTVARDVLAPALFPPKVVGGRTRAVGKP